MTPTPREMDRLRVLLNALSDGQLDAAGRLALRTMLRDDAAARLYYLKHMALHAALRARNQTLRLKAGAASAWRATEDSRINFMPTLSRASRRSVWYASAALIALAVTAWFLFVPETRTPTPQSSHAPASVAMLSDASSDAVFESGDQALGADLIAGPIRLVSGKAQIMFKSTAVVDLTGPCEFEMTGPNSGRLSRGAISALVRTEAHGFFVDLPGGVRLVDLGTQFAADVDAAGDARIEVTQGRVRIDLLGASGLMRSVALAAGDRGRSERTVAGAKVYVDRAIAVVNASFEKDGDGPHGRAPSGWQATLPARTYVHDHASDDAQVDGAVDGQYVGTINAAVPGRDDRNGPPPALYQNLDARAVPECVYTLSVAVGRRADYDKLKQPPTRWGLRIEDAQTDEVLAEAVGIAEPAGVMADQSVQWTADAAHADHPLRIRLLNMIPYGASGGKVIFDHVRLNIESQMNQNPTFKENLP
ncbi:MAG: hypothetical protein GC162_04190 [Planctomycetes bacterium]|nr:hypothetical protein [Planctomycetota bacterium]